MEENEVQKITAAEDFTEFSCKKFKQAGLRDLYGKWKSVVLITLFFTVISVAISLIGSPIKKYAEVIVKSVQSGSFDISELLAAGSSNGTLSILSMLFSVVTTCLVMPIFQLAYNCLFPILHGGKSVKFSDYVASFSLWPKALGVFWWSYLWLFLWALAGAAPGFVVLIIMAILASTDVISITVALVIGGVVCYAGLIAMMIIKSYQYSQMWFAVADNPNIGPVDAMNISKKITKGYKWKLFVLDLSFIGWALLCCVVWVGGLWLEPYTYATKFNAYKFLLNRYAREAYAAKQSAEAPADNQ